MLGAIFRQLNRFDYSTIVWGRQGKSRPANRRQGALRPVPAERERGCVQVPPLHVAQGLRRHPDPWLDAIGPYEVLSRIPNSTVKFVAKEAGAKRTDAGSLAVVAVQPEMTLPLRGDGSQPAFGMVDSGLASLPRLHTQSSVGLQQGEGLG